MSAPSDRVRVKSGAPVASDFASPQGTPVVIDGTVTTGAAYFLDAAEAIRRLPTMTSLTAWTPVDTSGASLSFTSPDGWYFRIGDLVIAWGRVTYPATASGANAKIGGLPFTVKNLDSVRGGLVSFSDEATLTSVIPTNNTTEMQLIAGTAVTTNAVMSGNIVYFMVIYPAA